MGKRKFQQTQSAPSEPPKPDSEKPKPTPKPHNSKKENHHRGRLIIRNLSFKTTEDKLKKHFEKFGPVDDVKLLKKSDGKLVGCGFVQFPVVQNAAKALFHLSGKPFLGRNIIVDWALPKHTYQQQKENRANSNDVEEVKVKEEPLSDSEDAKEDVIVKYDSGEDRSDSDSAESDEDIEETKEPEKKRPRVVSNDVVEGKTVFIKNVPFETTNEDLKQCMLQFGRVYYALVCIDPVTEHPKGTAFVKFVNKEDADKCLAAGTELKLHDTILDCHLAVSKNELGKGKPKTAKQEPKDSRNLYLTREGVILAGSKAAAGVSASDMAKRLQLEQWKSQMLRNLNMFVSKERLVIHNLPPSFDDRKLKTLFLKHSSKNAVIKEAKVMRDLKDVDGKGVGKSKEYGFVTFAAHENALAALRSLNNNPSIFTKGKRPIVSFSIENRSVLRAKNQRLKKSRLKNPQSKDYDPKAIEDKAKNVETESKKDEQPYSGVAAKPGQIAKMRSRFKLKTQAKMHREQLKKEKLKKKLSKKTLQEKKKDFIKQPKQKVNKKREDDSFSKLVNAYKSKLSELPKVKSKWYET